VAGRTFDVHIIEILVHWHAGRNNIEIAASLNADRKTVRKEVRRGGGDDAGRAVAMGEAEWDARVRAWFPELADTRLRQVTWPAIEPHHESSVSSCGMRLARR
jgi:IS30 family transposase